MWRTPMGDRALKGAEAELFLEGLGVVWDFVEADSDAGDSVLFGVAVFDQLLKNQKIAMLAAVSECLLTDEIPAPNHTAVSEGTIAAVYAQINDSLHGEIESSDEQAGDPFDDWRRLVLKVYRELEPEMEDLPSCECDDPDKWSMLLEGLTERIFWDEDYDLDDIFLDADPQRAASLKAQLTIDEEYFTAIPLDPSDNELEAARSALARLTGQQGDGPQHRLLGIQDELLVGPRSSEQLEAECQCPLVVETNDALDEQMRHLSARRSHLWEQKLKQEAIRADEAPGWLHDA